MQRFFSQRRYVLLWQALFLLLGTSWLWAPHLNHLLSPRTTLISQFETPFEPYAWLFRLGDVLSSALLIFASIVLWQIRQKRTVALLLLIIGGGLFVDPLITTTCHVQLHSCQEYISINFIFHAIETVITASTLFILSLRDSFVRKKVVSLGFVFFQISYGVLFLSQLADQQRFNTLSQFLYQSILVLWLAWFVRDHLLDQTNHQPKQEKKWITALSSTAAYAGGLIAVLASLQHLHLLGRLRTYYFGTDSAWLAQHSVIVGIIMLYLARHLARGELRARQIFLTLTGLEVLKYSVVSPHSGFMIFYLTIFIGLFIYRDDFERGTIAMTWSTRLRDLTYMLVALLATTVIALLTIYHNNRLAVAASRAFDNFFDYVGRSSFVSRTHLHSVLLAHTASAFIVSGVAVVLWILFRPYKTTKNSYHDQEATANVLEEYSTSSEDFFKLWPQDKSYFWNQSRSGFVAYRSVGAIIFALADPVGPDPEQILSDFISWAKAHRQRVCFLTVNQSSVLIYEKRGLKTLQIGSTAIINTQTFLQETVQDKWWRWQKNRAEKNGYQYHQALPPHSSDLLRQLRSVSDSWLTKEGRVERGFALGYFNEEYLQRCTIHYLDDGAGKVYAFANQLPQFKKTDVATIDLFRHEASANNVMPYLLYKTIESLGEEYHYFDLGFVPFAKAKGRVITLARLLSGGRFSSRGLEQFKNKFDPIWQPAYLAYDGDIGDLALIALKLEDAMKTDKK